VTLASYFTSTTSALSTMGIQEATPLVINAAAAAEAETQEEQVSRIAAAIARAKSALEEVKLRVGDYDKQYKASETASAYFATPIEKAQTAFDELQATASKLKDKTVEIPTKALARTLAAANSALEQISETATKYDEKFQLSSTVQKAVSIPREKCTSALVEASNLAASVSASANATLQGVNHGITSRVQALALGGAGLIFSYAAALDGRFAVENKAVTAGTAALGKAQELDERYSVKERASVLATTGLEKAQGLDSRFAGGRVTPLVQQAWETGLALATDGLTFVQSGYESAKQERQPKVEDAAPKEENDTSGGCEAAAQPAAAPEPEVVEAK